jgi:predicted component of type VI protein secretion system
MLIAAVLCLCAAGVTAALGLWSLARPQSGDAVQQVLRAVVPTQLAAAAMLGAGGVVALAAPHQTALLALAVCVIGAVGTVAAGCYQSAKAVARREAADASCEGACASCTLSCR